jgi:hypothetical protein
MEAWMAAWLRLPLPLRRLLGFFGNMLKWAIIVYLVLMFSLSSLLWLMSDSVSIRVIKDEDDDDDDDDDE